MNIPQSDKLSAIRMSQVFKNTTATYKFYWLIGLLDLIVKKGKVRMNVWYVVIEMVANAWYPVCYFHLLFGKQDSLNNAIAQLRQTFDIPIIWNKEELSAWLHKNIDNKAIKKVSPSSKTGDTFGDTVRKSLIFNTFSGERGF